MLTPDTPTVRDLPDTLQSILRERGVTGETPLISLKDGGNNQVCRLPGGTQDYVLKRYFQHPADSRDRFGTERAFYDLLWNGGVRQIPEPCAWDAGNRLGLFTFVAGRKLNPDEVTAETVDQALGFIRRINALRGDAPAQAIPPASEARFNLVDQLTVIDQRVAAVQLIEPLSETDVQALSFSRDELRPAWEETAAAIVRRSQSDRELAQPLEPADRCLSPSDFGFHNALLTPDRQLHFLDFEYAGWDDPAKLACDFFCQPQVPVPLEFWGHFTNSLANSLGAENSLPLRARVLLPAYQIKWCCILLNHFIKSGKARREFARGAAAEEAKAGQLRKSRNLLRKVQGKIDR